jgi:hypothetical protein
MSFPAAFETNNNASKSAITYHPSSPNNLFFFILEKYVNYLYAAVGELKISISDVDQVPVIHRQRLRIHLILI